jgi:molecular chaperone GrpE
MEKNIDKMAAEAGAIDETVDKQDLKQNNDENENQTEKLQSQQEENEMIAEIESLKVSIEELTKKNEEYLARLQRTIAEFDNYKKRTQKEKEAIYSDALCDVVAAFLPTVDNLDRAIDACTPEADAKSMREGVELVLRQFNDSLNKLGVTEIKSLNEKFDPKYHNAVMHVEDESAKENVVVEEFQKGYIYKDKVIRYSVVKVAN